MLKAKSSQVQPVLQSRLDGISGNTTDTPATHLPKERAHQTIEFYNKQWHGIGSPKSSDTHEPEGFWSTVLVTQFEWPALFSSN